MSELAPSEVLELLDADPTIEKRASWEAFEFTLLGDGDVEVVNTSHENPDDHTYTVHIESGIPFECSCPAFEYQEGPCKHMVAIAIREPLLEAEEKSHSNQRPEDCTCTPFSEELRCWPCYRDGFEEPTPHVEEDE